VKLTRPDLAKLIQWYHAVQDTNPKYLTGEDHALYRRLVSEVNGPIPEPGEGKPATCGECGEWGPACYPRVATDKACADARQEPSAAPGATKDAEPGHGQGQDYFRSANGAAMPRETK